MMKPFVAPIKLLSQTISPKSLMVNRMDIQSIMKIDKIIYFAYRRDGFLIWRLGADRWLWSWTMDYRFSFRHCSEGRSGKMWLILALYYFACLAKGTDAINIIPGKACGLQTEVRTADRRLSASDIIRNYPGMALDGCKCFYTRLCWTLMFCRHELPHH